LPVKVWIRAARLRTLPLAIAGTVTGNLLAYAEKGMCEPVVFILSILTAILLQVLSNYANDYGDFKNGADTAERTDRMMASGLITESKMKMAIGILIGLCLISGISLIALSVKSFNASFWILLGMGIAGLCAAYFYTAGKKPYGYIGLGDLSVFIFFGLLSVGGTYFLQAQTLHSHIWWMAAAVGFMSVGVLNINNIRDIETDGSKNKKTIPVRIGYRNSITYQGVLLAWATICITLYCHYSTNVFLPLNLFLFCSFFIIHIASLRKAERREEYNGQLKFLSLLTFGLTLFFCFTEVFNSTWD
jgi:1,4-dihydroxy-2-naphthoate octaprenyltransferase